MSIFAIVRTVLSTDTGITALVSGRSYPTKLPQNPTYEAITYQRISNTTQNGSTKIRVSRWQISCWAEKYIEAEALAAAVKAAFEEYSNTTQTPGIKMVEVANELDDYDDDAKVYRVMIDLMLTTTGD